MMGYRQIRTSDITGAELADDQVVTVVVRQAGKLLDASKEELSVLKPVSNVVELEYRFADGSSEEILVSKAEFEKLVTPAVLEKADSTRGRRKGFSPGVGSGA